MTHGRTVWWAKDAAWWRRERIVELGELFGADGPAVIDWLVCEAKAQNDGGMVKTGVRAISRGCFVDPDTVRNALSRAVTLGVLDDFDTRQGVITCRISGWDAEQEQAIADQRRAAAAARQAAKRSRDREETPANGQETLDVTNGDTGDESRAVTPSHAPSQEVRLTGQDRTGEPNPDPSQGEGRCHAPSLGEGVAPERPSGRRKREHEAYGAELVAFTARHFPGEQPDRIAWIAGNLRHAKRTPDVATIAAALARSPYRPTPTPKPPTEGATDGPAH